MAPALLILLCLTLSSSTEAALEYQEMLSILNQNCSEFLVRQSGKNGSHGDGSLNCPPWYIPNEEVDGSTRCVNKSQQHFTMFFMPKTGQPWMQMFYCMTTTTNSSDGLMRDIAGNCPFTFDMGFDRSLSTYYPLPCNISLLNDYTCAGLNREGQLCGRCVDGFAPPVFTYSFNCVNCTDYQYNWLKYIGIAFGPLTVFCLLICFLGITSNSPYLSGLIFLSQILSAPTLVRLFASTSGYKEGSDRERLLEGLYLSIFSIWNLDILRGVYDPFCLHPKMTILQALTLDYLIALYPLLLLLLLLAIDNLHDRNIRIIVPVWRPLRRLFTRPSLRNDQDDVQSSLLKSFATLYFLSAMKIQSISMDILSPTPLYYSNHNVPGKLHLLLAGDVEFLGSEHLPYAAAAILFLVTFLLLPVLLLVVYPYSFFQRFLNRINCNSIKLRIIMDVFQGNYRYRTADSKDYRIFAGLFFVTRFALVATIILFNSFYALFMATLLIITLGFSVAVLHPQTKKLHYILDSITLALLSFFCMTVTGDLLVAADVLAWNVSSSLNTVVVALPIFYIVGIFFHWLTAGKKIPQRTVSYIKRKLTNFIFMKTIAERQRLIINN